MSKRERDLLQKEIDLLKRENALLVRERVAKSDVNLRDVQESLPTFNNDISYPIEKWLRDMADNANTFGLTDLQLLVCVKKLLSGTPKIWLTTQPAFSDWQMFELAIKEEFGQSINSATIHQELAKRRRKPDEPLKEYVLIMTAIARRGEVEDLAIIQYIIDGIQDYEANKAILYGAESLQEFKRKIEIYEQIKQKSKNSDIKYGGQRKAEDARKPDRKMDRCYNCGGTDHKVKDCRNKEKGSKCFACNEYGHIASRCPKKQFKSETRPEDDNKNNSMQVSETNNEEKMLKRIKLNGFETQALIDTGSDLNLLKSDEYFKVGMPQLISETKILKGLGSVEVKTLGCFTTKIEVEECEFFTKIHLVPDSAMPMKCILGNELLRNVELTITANEVKFTKPTEEVFIMQIKVTNDDDNLNLSHIENDSHKKSILKIIENYKPKPIKTTSVKTKILLRDETPIYQTPRRLAESEKKEVDRQLEEWLDNGIIRPSSSDFSSPIVLVRKKNGSTRICIDYRKLNKQVVKDRYPLPLIEEQIDKLQAGRVFTSIDLKNGFFHVPVDEASTKYTSFVTPSGQFEFLRTPFGFCNSPAIFQRFINDVFRQLLKEEVVIIYMDDVIIPAENEDEAVEKLKKVLKVAEEYGLQIHWTKCQFLCKTIEYLGHEICEGQIRPTENKILAVKRFPEPKTLKSVQSFLGLTGYFRKFIDSYSVIAKPLTNLLKKDNNFKFGEEEKRSYEQLKILLSERPVLCLFKQNAYTEIHTDASKEGIGAILMQKSSEDSKMHPVYYYSKKTNPAERNYTSYELEVLAVISALRKFRVYLLGNQFKIVTDCSAFKNTMSKKELIPRIARWALALEDFDYLIEHRAGLKMKHVDALSRSFTFVVTRGTTDRMCEAQKTDARLTPIFELLGKGSYEDYFIKNGVLHKTCEGKDLIVVPKAMQDDIIRKCHEDNGHFAVKKTQEVVEREFWISNVKKKIEVTIANCIPCILANRKRGKEECFLHPIDKGETPLQVYHVDHLGPLQSTRKSYKHIFAVTDAFSKFTWIYPVKSTTAVEVIRKLEIQAEVFGYPQTIISDRGSCFTSGLFQNYCEEKNIKHISTTTGVARGNGQVERVNRTLIPVLAKLSLANPEEWYKYVAKLQRILNSTYHRSIDTTPFKLLFGTRMKDETDIRIKEVVEEEAAIIFDEERQEIRQKAKEQISKVQDENRRDFNKKRKEATKYSLGDLVAIRKTQFCTQSKLLTKFLGPYKVVAVKPCDRYDVEKCSDTEGPNKTSTSADFMKPWSTIPSQHDCDSSESDEEQDGRV